MADKPDKKSKMKDLKKTDIETLLKKRGINELELEKILKGIETSPPKEIITFEDYFTDKTKIGIISDSHIGHQKFDEPFWKHMVQKMNENEVSRVYHVGDILEGMSGREGHIYELSHIGFSTQLKYASKLFKMLNGNIKIFGINGNHDDWYMKKNNGGVDVSQELEDKLKGKYENLGSMEANVKIRENITMKLFHPNDGTAYATSYKLQKIVESLSGGEKPEILLEGHYHKALYMFIRNVHAFECGTMCGQTPFMRGKKIPAHKGFWIVDIEMGDGGIGSVTPKFFPGYK